MKIAVSHLLPNPFRELDRYPVKPEKIEALKRSIKKTGFWDNLVARPSLNKPGYYEIAYGHNRIEAVKDSKPKITEVDIPVKDLDDTTMILMMAHDNMEEWGSSAAVLQESIRAIVRAYAAGRIKLPKVSKESPQTQIRYAPSFKCGDNEVDVARVSPYPYTVDSLKEFLGWPPYRVEACLLALAQVEDGLSTEKNARDLTPKQLHTIGEQVRRAYNETGDKKKAREIGEQLAEGMRDSAGIRTDSSGKQRSTQSVTTKTAKMVTDELLGKYNIHRKPKAEKIPNIGRFASYLAGDIERILKTKRKGDYKKGTIEEGLEQLVPCKEDIPDNDHRHLLMALRQLSKTMTSYADQLDRRGNGHDTKAHTKPRLVKIIGD